MAGVKINSKPYTKGILIAGALLSVLFLLSCHPEFIECYYAQGMFPLVSAALRGLFNISPVSVGDIGYLLLIGWLLFGITGIIKALFQRRFKSVLSISIKGVFVLLLLTLTFYAFWGMNYFRMPAASLLKLQDTAYNSREIEAISIRMIDSLNSCRDGLNEHDIHSSEQAIFAASESAVTQLRAMNPVMYGWHPHIKNSLFSTLLNYMGTSGYNNPFTGEAQLNNRMPIFEQPVTACHEMAHQLGFAREDEANFIGFLAGIRSGNRLLRYSSYYLATQELLIYFRRRDMLKKDYLKSKLSPSVIADFVADSLYWARYQGKLDQLTGRFYNAFLKVNQQPSGLRTYNRMIILLVAWYRNEDRERLNVDDGPSKTQRRH